MQPIKPHWAWFFLGPVILFVGCIAATVLLVGGLASMTTGMQRVDIPGSGTVSVEKPGEMPLYYEQRDVMEAVPPLDLEVRITPLGGGDAVPIDAGFGKVTYNMNGVAGRKWGTASFPAAGQYTVETRVGLGAKPGQLAVGGNVGEGLAFSLVGFFAAGFGSFVLCLICTIVVAVKRSRYRRRMIQQQYAGLPPMPNAPPPGAAF